MSLIINDRVPKELPTGQISMSQVNEELGHASNAPISLGQADVRDLAEKPTGQISMSDLQGKSAITTYHLTVGYGTLFGQYYGYSLFNVYGALTPLVIPDIDGADFEISVMDVSLSDFAPDSYVFQVGRLSIGQIQSYELQWVFPADSGLAPLTLPVNTSGYGWTLSMTLGLGQPYFDYLKANNGNVIECQLIYLAP